MKPLCANYFASESFFLFVHTCLVPFLPFILQLFIQKYPFPSPLLKSQHGPHPRCPTPLCAACRRPAHMPGVTYARRFSPPPWKQAQGSASLLPLPPPQVLAPVSHENTRRLCRACIRLQMGALLSRHRAVPSHMCVLTCLVSTFPTDSAPGHPWHQLPASGGCHHRHEWRQDL